MLNFMNAQKHFEDNQFEPNRVDGWRKLKNDAVPTIFDVPNPPRQLAGTRRPLKRRCSAVDGSSGNGYFWNSTTKLQWCH